MIYLSAMKKCRNQLHSHRPQNNSSGAFSLPPAHSTRAEQGEENYRLLAENASDVIARVSFDGICRYISPSSAELLGYSPAELIGRRVIDVIHPLDRRLVIDFLKQEIVHNTRRKVTFRLRKKEGFYGWFEAKFRFFSHLETKEQQILAMVRDVTDRVHTERFNAIWHAITTIKASENSLDEEFTYLLKEFCNTLQWDMGAIWLIDEKQMVLRLANLWHVPSIRLAEFAKNLEQAIFQAGVGIAGTVWSKGSASHFENLPAVPFCIDEERIDHSGIVSAVGTVLKDGSRNYGVMVFFSRNTIQRNIELLNMLESAGIEIGKFISRFRAKEAFVAHSRQLGALVEEEAERIRNLEQEISRRQKLEQDVLIAAEVQRNLLPLGKPNLAGIDFAAAALPARYVSGDFYDFAMTSPSLCDIIIADVAGKGVATAMVTSAVRILFRASARVQKSSPSQILEEINHLLCEDLERTEMFVTAQIVRLDMTNGSIVYASAGHTEALHYRSDSGTCDFLPSTGLPIGVMNAVDIGQMTCYLKPGDLFIMYSDGITEAENSRNELFGMDRFVDAVKQNATLSAEELIKNVLSEVRKFAGNMPFSDDLTLIVLKATPRTIHFQASLSLESLDSISSQVRNAVLCYGREIADDLELIVSELATNAITHSRHNVTAIPKKEKPMIDIHLQLDTESIALDLYHEGDVFDPFAQNMEIPPPLQEGGRGILIVKALADIMEYSHSGDNANTGHWHIVRRIAGEDSNDSKAR